MPSRGVVLLFFFVVCFSFYLGAIFFSVFVHVGFSIDIFFSSIFDVFRSG